MTVTEILYLMFTAEKQTRATIALTPEGNLVVVNYSGIKKDTPITDAGITLKMEQFEAVLHAYFKSGYDVTARLVFTTDKVWQIRYGGNVLFSITMHEDGTVNRMRLLTEHMLEDCSMEELENAKEYLPPIDTLAVKSSSLLDTFDELRGGAEEIGYDKYLTVLLNLLKTIDNQDLLLRVTHRAMKHYLVSLNMRFKRNLIEPNVYALDKTGLTRPECEIQLLAFKAMTNLCETTRKAFAEDFRHKLISKIYVLQSVKVAADTMQGLYLKHYSDEALEAYAESNDLTIEQVREVMSIKEVDAFDQKLSDISIQRNRDLLDAYYTYLKELDLTNPAIAEFGYSEFFAEAKEELDKGTPVTYHAQALVGIPERYVIRSQVYGENDDAGEWDKLNSSIINFIMQTSGEYSCDVYPYKTGFKIEGQFTDPDPAISLELSKPCPNALVQAHALADEFTEKLRAATFGLNLNRLKIVGDFSKGLTVCMAKDELIPIMLFSYFHYAEDGKHMIGCVDNYNHEIFQSKAVLRSSI